MFTRDGRWIINDKYRIVLFPSILSGIVWIPLAEDIQGLCFDQTWFLSFIKIRPVPRAASSWTRNKTLIWNAFGTSYRARKILMRQIFPNIPRQPYLILLSPERVVPVTPVKTKSKLHRPKESKLVHKSFILLLLAARRHAKSFPTSKSTHSATSSSTAAEPKHLQIMTTRQPPVSLQIM